MMPVGRDNFGQKCVVDGILLPPPPPPNRPKHPHSAHIRTDFTPCSPPRGGHLMRITAVGVVGMCDFG